VRTRVGYCGGSTHNPTYRDLGDHTEALQIDYDPAKITYEKLLECFWGTHGPCAKSHNRQYRSAVFFQNEAQKKLALASRERVAEKLKNKVETEVEPLKEFFVAEDYHQKYYLRQDRELMREFNAIYPSPRDFVNSTAAARVNGYAGGHAQGLKKADIEALGLSAEATRKVQGLIRTEVER